MKVPTDKAISAKSRAVADAAVATQEIALPEVQFEDRRTEAVVQRHMAEKAGKSPQAGQIARMQVMAGGAPVKPLQRQEAESDEELPEEQSSSIQRVTKQEQPQPNLAIAQTENAEAPNKTGLPDTLKSGIEDLSGISLDDVKVHYNSAKPTQLQAHAFARGKDIHLASGQEKHLPHETWHVVQQAQGRVKPTLQMKGGVSVNDNQALEQEADVMGAKAASYPEHQSKSGKEKLSDYSVNNANEVVQRNIDTRLTTKKNRKEGTSASSRVNVLIEEYNRQATNFASEERQSLREEMIQTMSLTLQKILSGLEGVNARKKAEAKQICDEIEIEVIIMKHAGSAPHADKADKYAMFDKVKAHAVDKIATSEDTDLDSVLNYLTMARKKVAIGQHADAAEQFGAPRPDEPAFGKFEETLAGIDDMEEHTKIGGSGAKMGMFRTPGMKDDGSAVYGDEELAAMRAHMQTMKGADPAEGFTHSETADPDTIRDSTAAKEMYRVQDEDGLKLTATVFAKDDTVEYWHSTPKAIQAALKKAGTHHNALMKAKTTEEGLQELGTVTWYLTNAMPYLRGSAAISEWYNEAMSLKKELGLGKREGKIDLVAFRTDQKTYAETYKAIWENTPPNALPAPVLP